MGGLRSRVINEGDEKGFHGLSSERSHGGPTFLLDHLISFDEHDLGHSEADFYKLMRAGLITEESDDAAPL